MVTNYAIHMTVWNLLENKKLVSLSCRSELLSVLFSANDRFIGTTSFNELCVYDTENRYRMVSKYCGVINFAILVSTFSSDSWYVYKDLILAGIAYEIVKYDLTVKPGRHLYGVRFPGNAKAAAELQSAEERNDHSCFHKVGFGSIFILSNESILVSDSYEKEIKLFRLTEVIQKSNKKKQAMNWLSILRCAEDFFVSVNGRYFYMHDTTSNFHIV